MGLYTTSNTHSNLWNQLTSIGAFAIFGNIPTGLVLTTISASKWDVYISSYPMAPRSALLETITMSLAFSCSQTALTAAQAPPLPIIKTFLPSICTLCALTIYKNPPKSVLNPFNLPSTLMIVLTAPMALALSSISSK